MARVRVCPKSGLRKGAWTPEEDSILAAYIARKGRCNWQSLPKQAGLLRDGKSCRLRWMNYLRPDLKRGNFTEEEDEVIIRQHERLGNRWSAIALSLPGRTDNEIKNHWHTHLKKRNVAVEETSLNSVDELSIVTPMSPLASSDICWSFETQHQTVENEVVLDLYGEFSEDPFLLQDADFVEPSSGEFFIPQLEEVLYPNEVCNYNEIEMSPSANYLSIVNSPEEMTLGDFLEKAKSI